MAFTYPPEIAEAILERRNFQTPQLVGYRTKGGTYVLASPAFVNDNDQDQDLIAITPWGSVYALKPTAIIDAVVVLLERGTP